ncbi:MAG: glycoside hydrolase family protein [Desulfobacteraceae bacterium]|uniref:Lysozyme n=1 Tax=Candidatus Desulfacyla euxinica TaxID=2841693 RepID=A0A8J6MXI5_9DELT|nr:glycoside hydrolase family protein [Candidatus Desulfacyla euxinica]MBL6977393.1 glycoside hydrolase family protein [Desulfobacteraceae bacterium]MBL7216650.1 glycoside hydrolase family protein [Desulfobacteraceae bacterium]
MKAIEKQLIDHEGLEKMVYRCPAGKLTVGVGRNLEDKGITEEEALFLLRNDIAECEDDLRSIFTEYDTLDESRKRVLIDMRFNLGPSRFRQFKKLIAAVKEKDFSRAADEMKDSNWYRKVGKRAETLLEMMKMTG